eukprot:4711679-Ditylum_brightwellii.AAC.1
MPTKEFFEQIDEPQMLLDRVNGSFTDNQFINKAFSLIFVTGVHNKACKEWRHRPVAEKAWANFRQHFTNTHEELLELQKVAQQTRYTANMANTNGIHK